MSRPSDPTSGSPAIWRLLMLFLLASLGMLFAAGLVGYLNIRRSHPDIQLQIPFAFWISTVCLALGAVAAHGVWRATTSPVLSAGRLRISLLAMGALDTGFLAVQIPCMFDLLSTHQAALQADPQKPMALYGLVFALVLIHALHLTGGLIPLGVQMYRALRGTIEDRHVPAIRSTVLYWHFLEGVWVVLFAAFLLTN